MWMFHRDGSDLLRGNCTRLRGMWLRAYHYPGSHNNHNYYDHYWGTAPALVDSCNLRRNQVY